jgi:hypothetical protein
VPRTGGNKRNASSSARGRRDGKLSVLSPEFVRGKDRWSAPEPTAGKLSVLSVGPAPSVPAPLGSPGWSAGAGPLHELAPPGWSAAAGTPAQVLAPLGWLAATGPPPHALAVLAPAGWLASVDPLAHVAASLGWPSFVGSPPQVLALLGWPAAAGPPPHVAASLGGLAGIGAVSHGGAPRRPPGWPAVGAPGAAEALAPPGGTARKESVISQGGTPVFGRVLPASGFDAAGLAAPRFDAPGFDEPGLAAAGSAALVPG